MQRIPRFQHTYQITIPVYRAVPVGGGCTGHRMEATGETETHRIDVDIDLDSIVNYLGKRAAKSRGRRAKNGYVNMKSTPVRTAKAVPQ